MTIIIATKNNKAYYGNPSTISKLLNISGEAIRKQIRSKAKEVIERNGYIVYLNVEKVK